MERVDRLERLVNLVAALIDTDRPLTRSEIHERIEGYSDDAEAFRRNFERDKELLRQMGFPLVTIAQEGGAADDVGYRIPREQYELPDPALDDSELAALRLAAQAVQFEGEWGRDAVIRALRKLGGAASELPAPSGALEDRRIAALPGEEAAAVAYAAVAERRRIGFVYKGERRVVEPWRLSFHRGHWYLAGMDLRRGDERLFRLDRVEGRPLLEGEPAAFERPSSAQSGPPPAWRLGEEDEVEAHLLVDAEQARWARDELGDDAVAAEHPDGSIELRVGVTNKDALRSFVLGFLDHAEILGPPSLRDDMVGWLEQVAASGARQ